MWANRRGLWMLMWLSLAVSFGACVFAWSAYLTDTWDAQIGLIWNFLGLAMILNVLTHVTSHQGQGFVG